MPAPSSEDLGKALVALVRGPRPLGSLITPSRWQTAITALELSSIYLEYSGFCDP